MPTISFGNTKVVEPIYENNLLVELRDRPDLGQRTTTISVPETYEVVVPLHEDANRLEARVHFRELDPGSVEAHPDNPNVTKDGLLLAHPEVTEHSGPLFVETQWPRSQQIETVLNFVRLHSNAYPAWVEGDDEELVRILRDEYKVSGRPDDWQEG